MHIRTDFTMLYSMENKLNWHSAHLSITVASETWYYIYQGLLQLQFIHFTDEVALWVSFVLRLKSIVPSIYKYGVFQNTDHKLAISPIKAML